MAVPRAFEKEDHFVCQKEKKKKKDLNLNQLLNKLLDILTLLV